MNSICFLTGQMVGVKPFVGVNTTRKQVGSFFNFVTASVTLLILVQRTENAAHCANCYLYISE